MDDGTKKKVKVLFSTYLDLLENRKDINDQVSDLVKEISELTDEKKPLIRKMLTFWKKKYEDGLDELDDLSTLIEELGA